MALRHCPDGLHSDLHPPWNVPRGDAVPRQRRADQHLQGGDAFGAGFRSGLLLVSGPAQRRSAFHRFQLLVDQSAVDRRAAADDAPVFSG